MIFQGFWNVETVIKILKLVAIDPLRWFFKDLGKIFQGAKYPKIIKYNLQALKILKILDKDPQGSLLKTGLDKILVKILEDPW